MAWHLTDSVDEFDDTAGDFLRSRPVEHTVPLTLVDTLRKRGRHAYGPDDPIFGWWQSDAGVVDGAFLQTPPHPLLLTAAPAMPELAALLAGRPLPGVNAVAADAGQFTKVWQETHPVTPAAGMVRVIAVYTPRELRGHGYAGAVTTTVSRAALDAGADDVVLFTDLANPTSNALYQRLGYRPIEDRAVIVFES
jgi:GNAT superfamily N-acetyltransferase